MAIKGLFSYSCHVNSKHSYTSVIKKIFPKSESMSTKWCLFEQNMWLVNLKHLKINKFWSEILFCIKSYYHHQYHINIE